MRREYPRDRHVEDGGERKGKWKEMKQHLKKALVDSPFLEEKV
ncbi:hypothetical protein [Thermococcus sp.]